MYHKQSPTATYGLIYLALTIALAGWCAYRVVKHVDFQQNCSGYLKRAAGANSVELAKKELSKAVDYLEKNNLKTGYTSVVYKTPNEDIEFWYNNLSASLEELKSLPENATSFEKSDMLMQLREKLTEKSCGSGRFGSYTRIYVTCPSGISVYPANATVSFMGIILLIFWGITLYLWMAWLLFWDGVVNLTYFHQQEKV